MFFFITTTIYVLWYCYEDLASRHPAPHRLITLEYKGQNSSLGLI